MKVTFVLGRYDKGMCGIADTIRILKKVYETKGIQVEVVAGFSWKFNLISFFKKILNTKPDLVHFQYPATGLLPHALITLLRIFTNKKLVVTCHEFLETPKVRKLSMIVFSIFAHKLIWTNNFEKTGFLKWYPWAKNKSTILKCVGSNIDMSLTAQKPHKHITLTYFGAFRRDKGLDKFFELADIVHTNHKNAQIQAIGSVLPRHNNLYENLKEQYADRKVTWHINLSDAKVAKILSNSNFAYLPFTDGVSERRGSVVAVLGNGAVLLTTKGTYSTKELLDIVKISPSAQLAYEHIKKIIKDKNLTVLSKMSCDYAKQFDWDNIANKHIELYEEILQ